MESRSLSGLGLDPDGSLVPFHDPLADRETYAGARILVSAVQPLEDGEYALEILWFDADSVVAHA